MGLFMRLNLPRVSCRLVVERTNWKVVDSSPIKSTQVYLLFFPEFACAIH